MSLTELAIAIIIWAGLLAAVLYFLRCAQVVSKDAEGNIADPIGDASLMDCTMRTKKPGDNGDKGMHVDFMA